MAKNKRTIEVKGVSITITSQDKEDFISLSDIANGFEGGTGLIEKWIRNKNTIEFLAVWESLNNPDFNSTEFGIISLEAGTNRFMMSAKQWVQKTKAIGLNATAGRYGGTYAHKDIATEFCSWLSPEFKLLLIREFQRLKDQEALARNEEWDLKRVLSKVNYRLQTAAVKENIVPKIQLGKLEEGLAYASEADVVNLAIFGMTAQIWRKQYPDAHSKGYNIRDFATLHQLTVLSNLESYNAIMITKGMNQATRLHELHKAAQWQMEVLENMSNYSLDKLKSPNIELLKTDDNEEK
jgi:KilA-N domain